MTIASLLLALVLVALGVLSAQSLRYTWKASPWSSVGWAATVVYCLNDLVRVFDPAAGFFTLIPHLDYAMLIVLTIAFVVAGVRDEAQAEPWYRPTHRGQTRSERTRRNP